MPLQPMDALRKSLQQHWNTVAATDNFIKIAALLAAVLLLSAFIALPRLSVFGHDEVHYYADVTFRLPEDGRWLNYLLHDFLRTIPLHTWALVFLGLSWTLFYRLARGFSFEPAFAALVASTIVVAYPYSEQVLWPATATPGVLLVLAARLLAERGVPHPLIYVAGGILIFGTLQTTYFLLPLVFVDRFLGDPAPGERRWMLLFSHMCWWVAGSVAGVLLMSLIILAATGHFGPTPAAWRQTRPVEDLASLGRNLLIVGEALIGHLERFFRFTGWPRLLAAALALAVLVRARALLRVPQAVLLLAAVGLSFFVFSVPLAPLIHQRSLIAMIAAIVLFVAFLPGRSAGGRVLAAVLLLVMSHGFAQRDQFVLGIHETETGYFSEKLRALIPGHPMTYAAIALQGTLDPSRLEARTFNDPSLMHPIVLSLRAQNYLDCRLPSRCDRVGIGRPVSSIPFAGGQLSFSVDEANVGIVRFVPAGGKSLN